MSGSSWPSTGIFTQRVSPCSQRWTAGNQSVSPGVFGIFMLIPKSMNWPWASGPPVHVTSTVPSVSVSPKYSTGSANVPVFVVTSQPGTASGATPTTPCGIRTVRLVVPASSHPCGTRKSIIVNPSAVASAGFAVTCAKAADGIAAATTSASNSVFLISFLSRSRSTPRR